MPVVVILRSGVVFVEGAVRRSAPLSAVDVHLVYDGTPAFIRFPDGATCEVADARALAGAFATGGGQSQWQSTIPRALLVILLAFVLTLVALYHYGVPYVARAAAAQVPLSVTQPLDESVLASLDAGTFVPSTLPAWRQQQVTDGFRRLVGDEAFARYRLLFRGSPEVGPNAMALPGGTIVVTDELVTLARDDREILGVLAHEAGHVEHRHSVRMVMQDSALTLLVASVVGDVTSLLAVAPQTLLSAKYSRDLEREADAYAVDVMRRNGMPPAALADMLERIDTAVRTPADGQPAAGGGGSLLDYASSHPATSERLEYLRGQGR